MDNMEKPGKVQDVRKLGLGKRLKMAEEAEIRK